MKQIPLSQGKFALVDDEDFENLNQWKWYALKGVSTWYAVRNVRSLDGKQHTLQMHRFILNIHDSKIFIDHSDHDGLNNQRYNIRKCTRAQNTSNSQKRKNRLSKYKGVSFYIAKGKYKYYIAQIVHNQKKIFLGQFKIEKDAAKAYDTKAIELFGEFANINFK